MRKFLTLNGKATKLLFAALIFFCIQNSFGQAVSTAAGGNWSAPGTWVSGVPLAGQTVTIDGPVTLDVNTPSIASLTISATNTLTTSGAFTMNVAGAIIIDGTYSYNGSGTLTASTLTVDNGGILQRTNTGTGTITVATINISGGGTYIHGVNAGTIPTATWDPASTCQITGITNTFITAGFGQTFGNLTWNSAQTGAVTFNASPVIAGDFSVLNTGGQNLRVTNSGVGRTIAVTGNYNQSGTSNFIVVNNTGTGTLNVGGNFNFSGGTFTLKANNGAAALNIIGDFNQSGTATFATRSNAASTAVVTVTGNFNLSGTGTYNMSSVGAVGTLNVAGNFSDIGGTITRTGGSGSIIFNGSSTQTFTSGGTISNAINFTVNSGAILQMATAATVIGGSSGTFTLSSGAALGVTSASGITTTPSGAVGNIQVTGLRTYASGANYIYNGTTDQTTGNGLTQNTPNNVIITNPGNTVSLGAGTSIGGALTVNSGTLDANGQTTTVTGLTTVNGTYLASTNLQTFNGGVTISGGTFTGSSGNVTTTDVTLNSGTLTAPSGVFSVSGNWTYTSGTFTPGSNTVTFTKAAGTQTLNSGGTSFNNISHTGAGTLQLLSALITGGTFSNSAGSFDANGLTNTVTGLATLGGGSYLASTAAQSFNGGLTISGGTFAGSSGDVLATDVTLSSGTLTAPSGLFSVSGNWSKTAGTFTPGLNAVTFTSAGIQTLNSGGAPFNTISHIGAGTLQLATSALSIGGTFTNSSGSFDANGLTNTVAGLTTQSGGSYLASTAAQTFNGGLMISGGTFTGSSGSVTTTDVTLSSGTLTTPSGIFSVSGNWLYTSGTFTPGSNTVTFTSAGTQTLNSGGVPFYSIAHTGAGTLQLVTGALIFGGTFVNSSGSFDANGITNTITGLATVSGGSYLASTATQTFNGGLVISGGGIFTGSSGTISINGNLSVGDASSFSIAGSDFTVAGLSSIGGGASGSLSITSSTGNKTFEGLVTLSAGAVWNNSGNSDIIFQGGISRSSGTFTAGSGIYTFNTNSQSLTGTFSIPNVTVTGISLSNNNNLTVSSALIGTGSITQGINSSLIISGTSTISSINASNSGNTVTFNGTAQTVNSGTYNNLTIAQSSGDVLLGGGVNTNGVLTISSGNINLGSNDLTIGSTGSISGASASTRVLVSGTGVLKKIFTSLGSPFNFPIGDVSQYSPVIVDVTGGSFSSSYTISASVTGLKHPSNASTTDFLTRYWSITQSGVTGCVGTVTGTYNVGDVTGLESNIVAAQLNGIFNIPSNPWVKLSGSPLPTGGPLTATGATFTNGQPSYFTGIQNVAPIAAAGLDKSVCVSGTVTLGGTPTASGGLGGYTYSWSPTTGLSAANVANPIFTAPAVGGGTITYTVTVTDANGFTGTDAVDITVVPYPVIGQLPLAQTQCSGSSASFSVTATGTSLSYQWYLGAVPLTNTAPYSGVTTAVLGISSVAGLNGSQYSVVVTETAGGSCALAATPGVTLTVENLPTGSLGGGTTICEGSNTNLTFTLTGTGPYDVDYNDGTSTFTLNNVLTGQTVSVSPTSTKTYTITRVKDNGTVGGCLGISFGSSATVTVNPTPVVTVPVNQTVCNGSNTGAVNFVGTGTSYTWTNSDPTIGLAGSGSGNIAAFLGTNAGAVPVTATLTVTPVYTNVVVCNGPVQVFTITVNPTPVVTVPVNQTVCNGSNTGAINFAGTGTSYTWANDNTAIGLAGSGSGNIPAFLGTNATAAPVTGNITVTPVYTYNSVVCNGPVQVFSITVNPTPVVTVPVNQTVCNGSNTGAVNFVGTGTGYTWANDNTAIGLGGSGSGNIGSFTGTNGSAAPVTGNITVTPVYTNNGVSCNGPVQVFTITVNPTPVVTVPVNQTVCNGGSTAAVNFVGTGTSYTWTNSDPTIGLAGSGIGNIGAFTGTNGTAAPVTGTLTVTPVYTNNGVSCNGPVQVFTITVDPTATVNAVGNQTVCNGGNTVGINFSGTGATSYTWTNSNPTIGLAGSGSGNIGAFTGTNGTAAPVTGTITVTANNGLCAGTLQVFSITVNPTPVVTVPVNQTVCNGSNTGAVNFVGTGTSYTWTNSDPTIGLAGSGSGNIAAFLGTNAGAVPVTATLTVTPVYTNVVVCNGPVQVFTITVNPTPVVTVPVNQTVCNGSNTGAINFAGTGTSYTWANDNTAIGLAGSGSGNIPAFLGTNATAAPVTGNITVTPVYTYNSVVCNGPVQVFSITVNPTPVVTVPVNQTVCNGSNTGAVNFVGTGTGYTWANDNTAIGLGGSGSGNIGSFTGTNGSAAPVTGNITVTPVYTNNGVSCNGPVQVFTITVNPTPVVTVPVNQTVCNGGSTAAVNFVGTGTSYTWTNSDPTIGLAGSGIGNIGAFTGTNGTAAPVTGTLTVTPVYTNNGVSCNGPVQVFTITVDPTATVNAVGNQTVCNGGNTVGINFSGTGATSYTWTNSNPTIGLAGSGSGNIGAFTGTNGTAAPVTGTITVTANNGLCAGTLQVFSITVNPTPVVTVPVNQTVCNGSNTGAVNFVGTGTSYTWTNSDPTIGLAGSGSGNIAAFLGTNAGAVPVTATLTVTPVYTNVVVCNGPVQVFTITVNPTPVVTVPVNQTVCNGSNTGAINFAGTGTSYTWANDNTAIGLAGSGSGNIPAFLGTNATAAPVTGNITVTPVYTYNSVVCNGPVQVFSITVNPTPVVTVPVNQTVCNGSNTGAVNFVGTGTGYTWANDNTAIGLGGSGSGNIGSFTGTNGSAAPVTGNITVTPVYTNNGVSCNGPVQVFTITVNPTPVVTVPVNQTVCNGGSTAAVNFVGTGTSYTWTNSDPTIGLAGSGIGNIGAFTGTNGTAAPVTGTLTVTPVYTNNGVSCNGPVQVFTITVDPTATVNAVGNQTVCNGGNTVGINFSGTGATSYTWTNSNPTIGLAGSGSGNIGAFTGTNGTAAPVTGTITVTANNGLCAGTLQVFSITVNPTPVVTVPVNQTVCNGSNTGAVNFVGTGTSYTWTNSDPTIGLAGSGSGNIAAFLGTNAGAVPVTATLTVTPVYTNVVVCNGPVQVFTITVNPTPVVTVPVNQTVCNGSNTGAINFAGTGTSYTWANDNTAIGLAGSGSGNIPAFLGTNATAAPVTGNITVTPVYTYNSVVCNGPVQVFSITVNPTPVVTVPVNQTVCNGSNTGAVNFVGTGTGYTWANDNTAIGLGGSGSGNIGSFTGTNGSAAPVTGNITVTPVYTNNGVSCNGPVQVFTITVNPTPVVTVPVNQTVCNGGSTAAVNFVGTGTSYTWTNSDPTIGLAGSGIGNIGAFTGTNGTAAPVTGTLTVTPVYTNNGVSCNGPVQVFTITVDPTATVNAVGNQTVCNGGNTVGINFSGTGATSYTWTNSNPTIGLAGSGSGNIGAFTGTNGTAAPVTGTITVTANNGLCAGTLQVFSITVNPTPVVTVPVNQTVCNGSNTGAVNFVGTGTSYTWTNSDPTIGLAGSGSGNIAAFLGTNAGAVPVTATLTVTPVYTNVVVCNGPVQVFTITVNPTPVVTVPVNQTVCNGSNTGAINFAGTGTSYTWANDNTAIGLAGSGSGNIPAFLGTNATAAPVTGNITVTPVYTYNSVVCNGPVQVFSITVNPTPVVTVPVNQTVCNGSNTGAVNFVGTGTGYTWANDNTAIGLGGSGSGNIGSFTGTNGSAAPVTGNITVTPVYTNNGVSCNGPVQVFTITVNPTPVVTVPVNQTVCNGGSTAAVNFVGTGTSYTWTNSDPTIGLAGSGIGNIGAFTGTNGTAAPVTGTLTVTPVYTNNGVSCNGPVQVFTITVDPTATVNAVGNQTVCNGGNTVGINFSGTGATSYTWTNSNPTIGLAGSGSGNIGAFTGTNGTAAPVTGTITVTANNGLCAGTLQVFSITVNPTPVVTVPVNQTVCNGSNTGAVNFVGTGTSYTWTNSDPTIGLAGSGSGNIAAFLGTNAGAVPVTATLTVTPVYTNVVVCNGPVQVFTITVNPTPVVTGPVNQTVCNGSNTGAINFAGTGTSYTWANDNTAIGLAGSGSGNIPAFLGTNATAAPVTGNITVTPVYTYNSVVCNGPVQVFSITVNPTPVVTVPVNQTVCNGSNTGAVNFVGTGTGYTWANDNTAIGLGGSGSGNIGSFTGTNGSAAPVTGNITVTPVYTNNGVSCNGPVQVFTITVNPTPVVTVPVNQTVCNGGSTAAVNFVGTGTSYTWTNSDPTIGLAGSGIGNIGAFTGTNGTAAPVTGTLTVTPVYTNNGVSCNGPVQVFTITVDPTATVNAVGNQTVCNGGNTVGINFSGTGATSYTWTNSNPTIGLAGSGSGNIGAFTGTNGTAAPVTGTITVTANNGLCAGTLQVFSITVNPTPVVTVPVNQTVCNGSNTGAVNFVGTGTSYTWTNSDPTIGLAGSGSGNIAAFLGTNAGAVPVTATLTVTPVYTNVVVCNGPVQVFTITVNPTPVVTGPVNQTVCNGSNTGAINFAGTGTSYTWANDNTAIGLAGSGSGNIPAFLGTNATAAPVTGNITVTPVYTYNSVVCNGPVQVFSITVNPTPVVTVPVNQTVCNGSNTGAVNFVGTGTGYTWANDNTAIGLGGSGSGNIGSFTGTNGSAAPVTGNITVTPVYTNNGVSCNGPVQVFTITVNPTPVGVVSTVLSSCSSIPVTVNPQAYVSNGVTSTFSWVQGVLPGGLTQTAGLSSSTGNITGTFKNTSNGLLSVVYTVTPKSVTGSCTGGNYTITVPVQSEPVGGNATAAAICSNAGVNYNLQNNVSTIGNSQNSTFSWIVSVDNLNVTGESLSTQNGALVNDILVNVSGVDQVVNYTVTPTGINGCVGANFTVSVTVRSKPTFTNGPSAPPVCSNTPFTLTPQSNNSNGMAGNTFAWTGSYPTGLTGGLGTGTGNITETLVNTTSALLTATYTIVPTGGNGCVGLPFVITKDINPSPVITNPVLTLTQTFCGNGNATFTPTINVASSSYTWFSTVLAGTVTGVTAGPVTNAPINDNITNTGNVVATIRYRLTPTGPATTLCVGNFVDFVATINPAPIMTIVNAPTTICNGAATSITLNSTTSGAIITLQSVSYGSVVGGTLSALQTFTPGFKIAESLTNNSTGPLTVNYSFSVSANGCTNAGPFNTSVIVQPNANFNNVNSSPSICLGSLTNIILTSSTSGQQVKLTNVVATGSVTGFTPINTIYNSFPVSATIADNLSNPTNSPQTVTYTFEGSLGGSCVNPIHQTVVVTVNPAPPNLGVSNLTSSICSGAPVSITVNSVTANAVITLTNVAYAGAVGTLANGATFSPGFKITETLQNATNAPITVSYTFQVSANGCTNPVTQTTNVIVDPIPNASANNNLICSGGSAGVTITNPNNVSGTLYKWTVTTINVSGANNQPTPNAGPINDLLTATTNNQGSAVYTITPLSPAGCLGATYISTVTVQPIPSFSFTNSTPQVCSGSQVNVLLNTPSSGGQIRLKSVNYNGASGTLSAGVLYSDGQFITEVLTNSTNSPITVTYQFEAIVGVCGPSTSQTTTVIVNPNPSFTLNNTTSIICSGTQPSIALSSPTTGALITLQNVNYGALSGGLYSTGGLFTNGAVVTESSGGLVNNTNSPISITYTFSVSTPTTTPSCPLSVSTQSTVVQVLPAPTFTFSNTTAVICSGSQANITLNTSVTGAQVRLKSVSYGSLVGTLSSGLLYSNGQNITEVLVNPTNSPATVTYQFEAIVGGCVPSAMQSTNVIVNPIPVFSIANNTPAVCEGSPVNITLNSPTSNAVIALSAVTYNGITGTLSTPMSYTNGQSITETLHTSLTTTQTAVYSFTVAASNAGKTCNNTTAQQTTVGLTKQATVSLPADYYVCQPSSIALTGTIGGSAFTGLWSIVTGAGTLSATNVSGNIVTANYSVAPMEFATVVTFQLTTNDPDGSGPCSAATAQINVHINQEAQVFAPATLSLCQNIPSIALGGSIGGSTSTTLWTGGGGGFSNPGDPNATYSLAPSEQNQTIPITILLTLTAADPDGVGPTGPCPSVLTHSNLTINPLPIVSFSGFPVNGSPPQIAQNDSISFALTGNQIGGLFAIAPLSSALGATSTNPVDQVTFTPTKALVGVNLVTYTYTDANGCTNSTTQPVQVNAATQVDFALLANSSGQTVRLNTHNQWEVCANQGNVQISGLTNPPSSGKPASTITKFRSISYLGGPLALIQSDPLNVDNWYFVTTGLVSGTYIVEYDFENVLGVVDVTQRFVHVFASPVPSIGLPSSTCITSSIIFTDASAMPSVNPFGGVINAWAWDMNPYLSNLQNPSITYPINNPGTKNISLIVSTNQGCSATATTTIKVGDFPVPDFDWSNICNFDKTAFQDKTSFGVAQGNIVQYTWSFGDTTTNVSGPPTGTITGFSSTSGTYPAPNHVFPTFNNYDVTMTVNTDVGCTESVTKTVFILPTPNTIQPSSGSSYTEDFQATDGGWVPQALAIPNANPNYSWAWAIPNGANGHIQPSSANNLVWWTGANSNSYYSQENSAINGPCFDLSQLNRPMIALDYIVNAANNYDGAAMQYSTDGGRHWNLVGAIASQRIQGINWYKPTSTILSNPGGQLSGPYGWTDSVKTQWFNGRFNLDMVPVLSRKQVRIRIAFAATVGSPTKYDGFAFDNVFVGEKTKNVLVEEFTNANASGGLGADTYFNNLYANQITTRNGNSDFHDIQYHVRFPSPDVFNQANSDDPAARALFYEVQQPPYAVLDGTPSSGDGIDYGINYFNIDPIEIDRRALQKPLITIYKVDTVATGNSNTINARIHIQADTAITFQLYAQVALIEDSVIIAPFANPFRNVVRKLLYSGTGITSTNPMQIGDSLIFTNGAVTINTQVMNPKKLSLVAFVQKYVKNDYEMLQSMVIPVNYKTGSLVTSVQTSVGSLNQIQLFPNPADGKFNFALPGDFPSGSIWKISDQRGINVLGGDFNDAYKGEKIVNVSSLTNGMYIVAIGAPGQSVVYRKLVVLNSN